MKKNMKFLMFVVLVVFVLLSGCLPKTAAVDPVTGETVQEYTKEQVALWMNMTYNYHYKEYLRWFDRDPLTGEVKLRAGLTEDQKDILRKKKEILTKADHLIDLYTTWVKTGVNLEGLDMDKVELDILDAFAAFESD